MLQIVPDFSNNVLKLNSFRNGILQTNSAKISNLFTLNWELNVIAFSNGFLVEIDPKMSIFFSLTIPWSGFGCVVCDNEWNLTEGENVEFHNSASDSFCSTTIPTNSSRYFKISSFQFYVHCFFFFSDTLSLTMILLVGLIGILMIAFLFFGISTFVLIRKGKLFANNQREKDSLLSALQERNRQNKKNEQSSNEIELKDI